MKKNIFQISLILAFAFMLTMTSCGEEGESQEKEKIEVYEGQQEWTKDKTIYEINLRQYSENATFNSLAKDLPRIKALGMDILWFMPIFPISEAKMKPPLGSPYAVSDYKAVNPAYGTMDDFKAFVKKAHDMEMYVILDWVPNHTGWDHPWITSHTEYYTQNDKGEIIDPIDPATGKSWDWTDVADLNYDNHEMRAEMISDLQYWLTECDIDGYRMDVAHGVPQDFWVACNDALRKTNPDIFLLAEADIPRLRNSGGFEATYAWNLAKVIYGIGADTLPASAIDDFYKKDTTEYKSGYPMGFTTNHDENTWHGTVFERLGEHHKALAVFAATFQGMPLIYNGQEAPLKKRLEFFENDAIDWNGYEYTDFYKTLMTLKKRNRALWNGRYGGEPQKVQTGNDEETYAYLRERNGDKVLVLLNFSDEAQELKLDGTMNYAGEYTDVFMNQTKTIAKNETITLPAFGYLLLSNK
jgi:glycosidase